MYARSSKCAICSGALPADAPAWAQRHRDYLMRRLRRGEELETDKVFTLDRRGFATYRLNRNQALKLLISSWPSFERVRSMNSLAGLGC